MRAVFYLSPLSFHIIVLRTPLWSLDSTTFPLVSVGAIFDNTLQPISCSWFVNGHSPSSYLPSVEDGDW